MIYNAWLTEEVVGFYKDKNHKTFISLDEDSYIKFDHLFYFLNICNEVLL